MSGLSYLLLFILTQLSSGAEEVTGFVGHNVTLPCFYKSQTPGDLTFCWGQGEVPFSKCSNSILSSADGVVLFRQSPRYQLLGSETEGDASLTILDAQRSDNGVYGCRIEISGWFNDQKNNVRLIVEEAPVEQPATTTTTTTTGTQFSTVEHTERSLINYNSTEVMTSMQQSGKTENIHSETIQAGLALDAFLGVENIGRMAVLFFLTVTVVVAFLIRRSVLPRRTLEHPNRSIVENVYESVSLTK